MTHDNKEQTKRFILAARELGCDEAEKHFEEKLKGIAKSSNSNNEPSWAKSIDDVAVLRAEQKLDRKKRME